MTTRPTQTRTRLGGAAIVEFALVLTAFLLLLLGTLEMGRALFAFNSAAEATRRGARLAAVTAPADFDAVVVPEMQKIMPELASENVTRKYVPAGCVTNCSYLEVGIKDYTMTLFFWPASSIRFPGTDAEPGFKTTLPAESMGDN